MAGFRLPGALQNLPGGRKPRPAAGRATPGGLRLPRMGVGTWAWGNQLVRPPSGPASATHPALDVRQYGIHRRLHSEALEYHNLHSPSGQAKLSRWDNGSQTSNHCSMRTYDTLHT